MHLPELYEDVPSGFGNKGKWVYCKHLSYVFKILCKVDYDNEIIIFVAMYTTKEVMRLLELVGIVMC